MEIPKGSTVVFEGLGPNEQDFTSDLFGGFNVSKAQRYLTQAGIQPRLVGMSRADVRDLLSRRDINADAVANLCRNHKRLRVPLIACEVQDGPKVEKIIIDGVHRLAAIEAISNVTVDPILFRCYICPLEMRERIRIRVFVVHQNGTRDEVDYESILKQSWGKWS